MARARKYRKWDNFQRWLFFVAFVSVLPLVFSVLWSILLEQPVNWTSILGKGELLIAALALSADAAGGLAGRELHAWRLLLFIVSIIMSFITAGLVSLIVAGQVPLGTETMANYSLGFFIGSLTIGLGAKVVVED